MSKSIIIPEVNQDNHIGSVFNHLFYVINETENSEEQVTWDFRNINFLHPFFIAPLSIYKYRSPIPIEINLSANTSLEHYFNLIHFDAPMDIQMDALAQQNLLSFIELSYTPISRFNVFSQTELIQTIYKNVINRQSRFNVEISTPLSYLLSELMDNMVEHSLAKSGFIFSQYSNFDHALDICIADDGISVLGSFMRKKRDFVLQHNNNEAEILKFATEGVSTKNLPYGQNRGFGLSTSKRMLVEGLGGEFFILSGNAFHRHCSTGMSFINLPSNIAWPGTIILLKIPMEKPMGFNYLNFIQ